MSKAANSGETGAGALVERQAAPRCTGASQTAARAADIDVAKGLAIVLVVFGHLVARDIKPVGQDWYGVLNAYLYTFHMAFFFYLSGYVYFLKPAAGAWARWIKTARRLVPAYILFAVLVYAAKRLAVYVLPVDRPAGEPLQELLQLILYPTAGVASFLWFIVVLLQVQLLTTAVLRLTGGRVYWALGLAITLHLFWFLGLVPELFALHQVCRYLVFYMLAALVVSQPQRSRALLDQWGIAAMLLFAATLLWVPMPWLPTLAGLLCLPALHALARRLQRTALAQALIFLGAASLTIYLMNSLAIGLVKGFVLRSFGWDGWHFWLVAPALRAAGLILPIVAQRLVFARVPALDRITR